MRKYELKGVRVLDSTVGANPALESAVAEAR
jgi:hypothetical protein